MKNTLLVFISLTINLFCFSQTSKEKNASRLEGKILDTIWKLPEVKQQEKIVRKLSKNKRHLSVSIFGKPSERSEYYWVKVCEDNGIDCATYLDFYVNPATLDIKFYDPVKNKSHDLRWWRKHRKKPSL